MTPIAKSADMIEEKVAPSAQTSDISKEPEKNVDALEASEASERSKDPGKPD